MKKTLCLLVIILSAINFCNAQNTLQWGQQIIGDQKPGLFRTYEDLANDKIDFVGEQDKNIATTTWVVFGKQGYMFKKADYYGFKDYYGNRNRIFAANKYTVLSYGKIFLYSKNYELNCRTEDPKAPTERCVIGTYCTHCPIGQRYSEGSVSLFYSTTFDTAPIEIKKWNKLKREELANIFFKDNETIKAEFTNDTKENYYSADGNGALNDLERLIFYINKLNGLIK